MGALVAIFCIGIFSSTTYMATTCYNGVCPKMIDTTPSHDQEPLIVDAEVQPRAPKATPKDYYATPNPAQF